MTRRRTAFPVLAASALLAAVPLLTACGSAAHPGAAAVVDGKRITEAQLQGEVQDVRNAQRQSPNADQLMASSGQLTHNTLIRLIQYQVIEHTADANGVGVSRRDVQQAVTDTEHRTPGGESAVRAAYLEQGIAPSQIDDVVRMGLLRNALEHKLGISAVNTAFQRTSKSLDIVVNPRYGAWDDKQGTSVVAAEPWLHLVHDGSGDQA
jgi:hypothetical protein